FLGFRFVEGAAALYFKGSASHLAVEKRKAFFLLHLGCGIVDMGVILFENAPSLFLCLLPAESRMGHGHATVNARN
ncbi:hypothetical protein CEXT_275921, partial [Caerostris extrusa]